MLDNDTCNTRLFLVARGAFFFIFATVKNSKIGAPRQPAAVREAKGRFSDVESCAVLAHKLLGRTASPFALLAFLPNLRS